MDPDPRTLVPREIVEEERKNKQSKGGKKKKKKKKKEKKARDIVETSGKRESSRNGQKGKKAPEREDPLSAENLDITNAVLTLGWTLAGILLRIPQEVIIGGASIVGGVGVAQTLKAKFEGRRERRRIGGKKN